MDLKKIIRKEVSKFFNENYNPTFDIEDIEDMEGNAKQAFLQDFEKEYGEKYNEPFKEPTQEELNTIKNALSLANLDLPSDTGDLAMAEEMVEKQLAGIKTPHEINRLKNIMDNMWGKGSLNESKGLNKKMDLIQRFLETDTSFIDAVVQLLSKYTGKSIQELLAYHAQNSDITLNEGE
jgi:hypothetical protein